MLTGETYIKLHNLQHLEKQPMSTYLRKMLHYGQLTNDLKGKPTLHLYLNFNWTALNCYFIDK